MIYFVWGIEVTQTALYFIAKTQLEEWGILESILT